MSTENGQPGPTNGWDAFIATVRATWTILLVALLSFVVLGVIWYTGWSPPWRSLTLFIMTLCVAGPFAMTYCVLAAWVYRRKSKIPVQLVDTNHKQLRLDYWKPSRFSDAEIVLEIGDETRQIGELPSQQTRTGQVYVAEEHRVEQRERVTEDGEIETYAQDVLVANWEGFIDNLEFMENVAALRRAKQELVPLAAEALEAKAGRDIDTLRNTDKFAGALLLGAEKDTFFQDHGDAFDWDNNGGVDHDDLEERVRAVDRDDEREAEAGAWQSRPPGVRGTGGDRR